MRTVKSSWFFCLVHQQPHQHNDGDDEESRKDTGACADVHSPSINWGYKIKNKGQDPII